MAAGVAVVMWLQRAEETHAYIEKSIEMNIVGSWLEMTMLGTESWFGVNRLVWLRKLKRWHMH